MLLSALQNAHASKRFVTSGHWNKGM